MKTTTNGNVLSMYFDVAAGWEQWFLLASDVHFDSVYCNRDLFATHLKKAKERDARIMIFGDLFDAMQGRFDPRRSMEELRPEYRRSDYYDFVVKDIAKSLSPYASQITLLAKGNHETSVLKNANTDLMDRLVFSLNTEHGGNVSIGAYGGWVRLMFERCGVPQGSMKLKYFHGAGGEAPVTRGAIQTNRQAVYLPDADIVVNGHSHNAYWIPISRERLSGKGVIGYDIQHHVRTPGYKQSYADGSGGWEVERGGVPKPIGSMWMRMFFERETYQVEFTPAIYGAESMQPAGYGDDNYRPFPQEYCNTDHA